ncbi:hypothetical protein HDF16_005402 [Granulicella aggregans]|uniref:Uncharacterized protein n=1 Tax=Granulicella aggregans TaxID=474949 RepID=A0A7W7ZIT0_9BACT|nr:hypothetical protein [Granulicella aggregans]
MESDGYDPELDRGVWQRLLWGKMIGRSARRSRSFRKRRFSFTNAEAVYRICFGHIFTATHSEASAAAKNIASSLANASYETPQDDPIFTEVVAIRSLLNMALKTLLLGEKLTPEEFSSLLTIVRTEKRQVGKDVMQQYLSNRLIRCGRTHACLRSSPTGGYAASSFVTTNPSTRASTLPWLSQA